MAFRWRADDGPTLNVGLVVLRISRDPAKKFYILVIFQGRGGGSGPPVPPLDPCMGPDNVYTYWDILKTHFIVRICFCTTLCVLSIACTMFEIDKAFFPEFHSTLIWIQTLYANVNRERKRERLIHAHPFREIKSTSTDRQVEREREWERDVCSFWISSFFWLC